jgi:glutamyl-tRNA synthetase
MTKRTRFAPTPSGFLHLGNLYHFVFTWLWAKKEGMEIVLRIDDLDRQRFRPSYLDDIFYCLELLGLDYQIGPSGPTDFEKNWSQLKREEEAQLILDRLLLTEQLFACQCSRKEIAERDPEQLYHGYCAQKNLSFEGHHAWRLHWQESEAIAVRNLEGKAKSTALDRAMQYAILRKKDGHVAYQIASLADDLHFKITHIVRGLDLWPSTVLQNLIAKKTGSEAFMAINFWHHPLVKGLDKRKLSKSQEAPAARQFIEGTSGRLKFWQWLADLWQASSKIHNEADLLEAYLSEEFQLPAEK